MESTERAPRRRKQPRKLSPRYLENAALFHLKRYSATTAQLRRVLLRKADRSIRVHGGDRTQAASWIDALVGKLTENGYLNDSAVARMKATSLRASGKSARMISMKLRQKGLSAEIVNRHVNAAVAEVSEEDAAKVHARKKRLGPFRRDVSLRKEKRAKDLAAMARAGFSYAVCRRVIDGEE